MTFDFATMKRAPQNRDVCLGTVVERTEKELVVQTGRNSAVKILAADLDEPMRKVYASLQKADAVLVRRQYCVGTDTYAILIGRK